MRLDSEAFAADPHGAYSALRKEYGPLAPVELADGVAATLVLGYREALQILGDPARFPTDPTDLSAKAGWPALPLSQWRPSSARGEDHTRYRQAYIDCLARVDLHALRTDVIANAVPLINSFCGEGAADLLNEYAVPLTVRVMNALVGFPPEADDAAFAALTHLRDAADAAAAEAAAEQLAVVVRTALADKRSRPGSDVMSALLTHPSRFSDAEITRTVGMMYEGGAEPTWNLIANTLLEMTNDVSFRDVLLGGSLSTRDAIDDVLFGDPPMPNGCVGYPRQPQIIGATMLPPNQPVITSMAASNNDPTISGGDRTGNRSHLAWGAGPHTCPDKAQAVAMVIATEAVEQLLDVLPEIELAEQPQWRRGAFHRALTALPVTFPKTPPLNL
ncbi:Cytochrome P450 [Nocardia amikacinitolerans]|uniref:Cytochrome P450 n=1 Tax=Nocardia amikacinitolerans TaxID=756689 RepID=A0A285L7S8_9NOCA|nr:cytochrome P450 [Nocardia amikacinitolerans]SNY80107.1 Cytochrome P450 [Nocardia amikacinitolerans]